MLKKFNTVVPKALFLVLLSVTAGYAQYIGANSTAATTMHLTDEMRNMRKFQSAEDPEPFEGTPYLSNEFEPGIVTTTKSVFTQVPLRYNIEGDYFEFKQKDVIYILDPSPTVKKVTLSNQDFIVDDYTLKGKTRKGYYVLLDSGKVTVMAKKKIFRHPASAAKALESEAHLAKYEHLSDEYHYKLDGSPVKEIPSIKKLIEVMPDHQEELKQFVSKERISRKPDDLTKLARYYNQLQ